MRYRFGLPYLITSCCRSGSKAAFSIVAAFMSSDGADRCFRCLRMTGGFAALWALACFPRTSLHHAASNTGFRRRIAGVGDAPFLMSRKTARNLTPLPAMASTQPQLSLPGLSRSGMICLSVHFGLIAVSMAGLEAGIVGSRPLCVAY